jgi:hypothetical protein
MIGKARVFGLFVVFVIMSFVFTSSALAGSTTVTSSGVKFPDGTTQTTAASGGGSSFWSQSDSNIYYNNGEVGIGTVSPTKALTIRTPANLGDQSMQLRLEENNGQGWDLWGGWAFQILDDGVNRVWIGMDGNVGIGTTSPEAKLDVNGHVFLGGGPSENPQIIVRKAGDIRIRDSRYGNSGYESAQFNMYMDNGIAEIRIDKITDTDKSGTLVLAAANVGIGGRNSSYKLYVNGTVAGTSWTNISSRDYKEDIRKVDDTTQGLLLAKVMEMELNSYKYKKEYGGDGETKLGFIAEDMPEEVLSKDGKGVDLYELLTVTIGAVKAQQKKIAELMKRLDALER